MMEITMMLCGHYKPDGCLCPARRRKWWTPARWLLGPYPECIYDERPWDYMSEADRKLWTTAKNQDLMGLPGPVVCPYLVPLKPDAS